MEELDYSVLYRWFVGLSMDDPVWDATTFTKNRDRLLQGDIADAFFAEVLAAIRTDGLLSDEHFTVDGTLLEAWASHKSFKPKQGRTLRPTIRRIRRSISTANGGAMTRISRPPTRTRVSTRRRSAVRPSWGTSHIC